MNSSSLPYALFLSVIMKCIIVYHISWDFIYLRRNPHTVFISLWFRQNWLFFTVFFLFWASESPPWWKDFLKVTLLVRARAELRTESRYGHTDLVGWERVSAGRGHLFTLHPRPAVYLPFFHVGVSYLPVMSGWKTAAWGCRCGGESLTLAQLEAHILQHPCFPLPGSAASHGPALVQFQTRPFSLSQFFVNDQNQRWVKKKKRQV